MSRSLVGSSRSSTFGSSSSSSSSWKPAPLATGEVTDPGGQLVAGEAEALQHRRSAVISAVGDLGDPPRTDSTIGSTRAVGSRSSSCVQVRAVATVRRCLTRPAAGRDGAREQAPAPSVLPAPLTPTMPTRSPGPSRQVACRSSARSPRHQVDVLDVQGYVLAEPLGGEAAAAPAGRAAAARPRSARWRRRCGTSASRCAPGARGAARRAPCGPGSAGVCLAGGGLAAALRLGQHVGGVAALVGVDRTVVDLPGPLADLVEEPPVVGDDHQGEDLRRTRCCASQATRLDVEVVGRLVEHEQVVVAEQQRRQRAPPALATGERRCDRPRSQRDPGRAAPRRPRGCGRRPPTRGRPDRRAPPRGPCGCRRARRPGGGSRRSARAAARPGPSRPPRARSSPPAGSVLPSPLRPTMPIRSPAAMPSETSLEQRADAVRLGHALEVQEISHKSPVWAPATAPLATSTTGCDSSSDRAPATAAGGVGRRAQEDARRAGAR